MTFSEPSTTKQTASEMGRISVLRRSGFTHAAPGLIGTGHWIDKGMKLRATTDCETGG